MTDPEINALIESKLDGYRKQIDTLESENRKLTERRRPDWSLLWGFVSFVIVLITGGWALVGLKTEHAVNPLTVRQASMEHDIEDLTRSLAELKTDYNAVVISSKASLAAHAAKLIELDTKLVAIEEIRNVQMANQSRINGIIWVLISGKDYPAPYEYPPNLNQPLVQ